MLKVASTRPQTLKSLICARPLLCLTPQVEGQTRDYRSPARCRWGSEPRRYEPGPASLRELPGLAAPPTTQKSPTTRDPSRAGFVSPSPPSCRLHRSPLLLSKETETGRGVNIISHVVHHVRITVYQNVKSVHM